MAPPTPPPWPTPSMSWSMASGTGLYDQFAGAWDAELTELLRIAPGALVPPSDEPRGLSPDYSRRWPGLAGIPWFAALGDGACALPGSGCSIASGRAALT